MDWKTLAAPSTATFLAEPGDKTQISLFLVTAQGRPRLPDTFGGCAALVLSTVLAVAAGALVQGAAGERFERRIRILGGLVFVALGLLMLFGKER